MNEEVLTLKILDGGGICFQNGDDLRRLREIGFLKPRKKDTAKVKRSPSRATQEEMFRLFKVRDVEHYRSLVGNPRSNGLLVRFKPGDVLKMERVEHPLLDGADWFVVLDTAIGGSRAFIEELTRRNRVQTKMGT